MTRRLRHSATSLAMAMAMVLTVALAWSTVALAAAPGSLDGTFGGGTVTLGSGATAFGVAVQPDDQVVVAGQSGGGAVLVERLSATGQVVGTYIGPAGYARAVRIAPGGKIVVAGSANGAMFVARLTSALAPDPSFGSGGYAYADPGTGAGANGVAVASDGSVVAAGAAGDATAVARFSAAGALQWTQGGFGGSAYLTGVAIQGDGKAVVVGTQSSGRFINGLIARLTTTGALDSAFVNHGATTYSYPDSGYTSLTGVTLQINGQIVASGAADQGPEALAVRFNSDGTLDGGFGNGGAAALVSGSDVVISLYPMGGYGIGIAGGGRIVEAGNYEMTGTEVDQALYAFTPSGGPEPTFAGTNGTVRGPTGSFEACGMAIAPDGSLVTVGDAVASLPDSNPCGLSDSGGFVTRYVGFGPPPANNAPTVATGSATAVTATSATVAGQVNPGGLTTGYHFEYGTTTSYGSSTPDTSVAGSTTTVPATTTLPGLKPGTTYHYRLDAGNSQGTASGADATFTTTSAAPAAVTGGAKPAELGATISGTVNPSGQSTSYSVQFGKTSRYGSTTRGSRPVTGAGTKTASVRLTKLTASTTYHYRLVATNSAGTGYGQDRTFKTLPLLRASVTKLARSYSIVTAAAGKLAGRIACNQACSAVGSLRISARAAQTLKLGQRSLSIASGRASLRRSGTTAVALKLTQAAKRALAHSHGLSVTLRIVIKPVGPGRTVTTSRTLTLSR